MISRIRIKNGIITLIIATLIIASGCSNQSTTEVDNNLNEETTVNNSSSTEVNEETTEEPTQITEEQTQSNEEQTPATTQPNEQSESQKEPTSPANNEQDKNNDEEEIVFGEDVVKYDSGLTIKGAQKIDAKLLEELNELIAGKSGLSFYLIDSSGEIEISYNPNDQFIEGDALQIAYAMYVMSEIEKGNGSLDDLVTYKEEHFDEASEDIKYIPFGVEMPLERILSSASKNNDPIAVNMLKSKYPVFGYNQYVKNLGLPEMQLLDGKSTGIYEVSNPAEIRMALYNYSKESKYGEMLLGWSFESQETYVPKSVMPHNNSVATMQGWEQRFKGDGGFVDKEVNNKEITYASSIKVPKGDRGTHRNLLILFDKMVLSYNDIEFIDEDYV